MRPLTLASHTCGLAAPKSTARKDCWFSVGPWNSIRASCLAPAEAYARLALDAGVKYAPELVEQFKHVWQQFAAEIEKQQAGGRSGG